ncbi:auxin-induced protein, partial [Musa troglodytarum]
KASPASAHGQACVHEEREDIVISTHRHPPHLLLINAGSKLPHTVLSGAESTDTLSCYNEEARELQQVLPGLQAVRRHDLAPIRLRHMNIITKVSLDHGMSHYVLVVCRHAFATPSIAPFALILERPVIDQNFYYAGLKFTTPTFSCAMSNMLPAMTFVLAVLCRMEKDDLKKVRCQAKVGGTLVTLAGALMTLYKGPLMEMVWTKHIHGRCLQAIVPPVAAASTDKDWFKGCIFLVSATLAWASLFILQGILV